MFGISKKVRLQPHPQLHENNLRPNDVVGESKYQDALTRVRKHETSTEQYAFVALRAEPSNPYDPQAIRIDWVLPDGSGHLTVGYVPRNETGTWHPVIASAPKGTIWVWPAETIGDEHQTIGIRFLS